MKAHLMYRDADFDPTGDLPAGTVDLELDLDLPTVYATMARNDKYLYDVARHGMLSQLEDPATITYRQQVLRDCLSAPDVVRALYDLAVDSIAREKKVYIGIFSQYPSSILHRSVEVLEMFVGQLHRLRDLTEGQSGRFASEGFRTFFAMISEQLSDEYFVSIQQHLQALKFRAGVHMSAQIGGGNKGVDYVLRRPPARHRTLSDLLHRNTKLSFTVSDRDEAGHQALADLRDRGINLVADATARSADHILSFFTMLRAELGFYVGCVNLYDALCAKGAPVVEPQARPRGNELRATGLYDVALALAIDHPVVGNDLSADGADLIVITGANKGGKSTFLRSIGLAYLLMQAGMFVPATAFAASVSTGVHSHFKREEDATMRSGKLDEEMARMSAIVDRIRPGGLLLCNESFASTNEREGSEISRQIIAAMVHVGVRVLFVTHLYDLSAGLYRQHRDGALFLRAQRDSDGGRPFLLLPGEPLATSFGPDVYARVFAVPRGIGVPGRGDPAVSGGTQHTTPRREPVGT